MGKGADREGAKVPFVVRGDKRGLEGVAATLNMVVQGRGLAELRANIVVALRDRFGREQAFSMLVGAPPGDRLAAGVPG